MKQSTLDLSYVRVVATVEGNLATERERQKTLFTIPAIFSRFPSFALRISYCAQQDGRRKKEHVE